MTLEEEIEAKNEVLSRSLYVGLKKVIRSEDDVKDYLNNYERIQIKRSSRNCYVVYKTIEDCKKDLEKLKTIENVYAAPRRLLDIERIKQTPKPNKKKIKLKKKINEVTPENILLVKNIPHTAKVADIKAAFPGCRNLYIFKGSPTGHHHPKRAKLKMDSPEIAMEYLKKIREIPTMIGEKLQITTPNKLHQLKVAKRKARKSKKLKQEENTE